jgi:CRISPR-associated protein Cas2
MLKIVITYDIQNDKKRLKISDLLEKFGLRVNYSVFEIFIQKNQLKKLVKDFEKIIDKDDSIRFYILDEDSVKKAFTINDNKKPFEFPSLFF